MNETSHLGGLVRTVRFTFPDARVGNFEFDEHKIQFLGLEMPVPEPVLENSVSPAHWREPEKERVRRARYHMLCWYKGTSQSPVEQYLAFYRLALAALPDGLAGVLNEEAWTFTPPAVVGRLADPNVVQACRDEIPGCLWTGFVKFFTPDGACWFVTKGNHRFGVPDFAVRGWNEEAEKAADFLHGLFLYAYRSSTPVQLGHTIQMGDGLYRFDPVTEYSDYLEGPSGTLVVNRAA